MSKATDQSSTFARTLLFAIPLAFAFCDSASHAQTPALVEFFSAGKAKRGLTLVELTNETVVLGRDGWLHTLEPDGRVRIRHVKGSYSPVTATEMRNDLRVEFGKDFEVLATKNFLVVQPRGRGKRWPNLFEQSHRSFISYMSKRGVKVREGRFPMVAVVFPDQKAMYDEFERLHIDVSRVAGLYSNSSNRVMTHDGGRIDMIAETVRHEAAHQSAFNFGVHSRVTDTPKWITEGIGQMFEPAEMTSSKSGLQARDRVNHDSMRWLRANYKDRNDTDFSESIFQLIGADTMFDHESSVDKAYAISWAMMFYLAERQPRQFAELLNHAATRPPFQAYKRADRIRDFEKLTGIESFEFSKRVGWFLQSL